MKTSEKISDLAAALMVVQNTVGNLPKTAKGYGYNYTPLDEVTSALSEPLAENGLAYVQMPSNIDGFLGIVLTTRLMHVTGQWLEDTMIMPIPELAKGNEAQAYGAGLTYARRYALTAMFGIAADEDTDARPNKPVNSPKVNREKKAPVPPPAPIAPSKNGRPLDPEAVKGAMLKKTTNDNGSAPSDKQRRYAVSSLSAVTTSDPERHTITAYLFGKQSANDLTASECSALIDWIDYRDIGNGDWQPNEDAWQEAVRIIRQDARDKGQKDLFPD